VGKACTLNPETINPEWQGGILRGLMRGGSPNGREREESLDGAYVKLATQVVILRKYLEEISRTLNHSKE
jgi:hypothetical protein